MPNLLLQPLALTDIVPEIYWGVWKRTLLRTPQGEDTTTFVRWLQGPKGHADLRVPLAARPAGRMPTALELATQQGFAGITEVTHPPEGETCAWRRQVDFQPPPATPDEGRIHWDSPDRLIETGVHGDYLEVWERVPGSQGQHGAWVAEREPDGITLPQSQRSRYYRAGQWAMRVRPRRAPWPSGLALGTSLATLGQAQPDGLTAWLDFEISWGPLQGDQWLIERSTLPALEGRREVWPVDAHGQG